MPHHVIAQLVHHLGVVAIALGAAIEGETAVVIGGAAAAHGVFNPYAAGISAFIGSFTADQIWFALGRWRRQGKIVSWVRDKPHFSKAIAFVEAHPAWFCFGFRFIYGFRTIGPVAIGASKVPTKLFAAINFVSAAIWAAIFTTIGVKFGKQAVHFLRGLFSPAHLAIALGGIAVIALAIWLWNRKQTRAQADEPLTPDAG
jgi:membrane protein DedA with SNARE-associated domain